MNRLTAGVRITFEGLNRADANRASEGLRQALVERVGDDLTATIEKEDPDSQDGGATLVLLFGTAAAVELARGIRAYLARRGDDRDQVTITTADGTEIVATGEAARTLDAAALIRAVERTGRADAQGAASRGRCLVLFVAANPHGTSGLALDEECAAVERELAATQHREDIELRSVWAVSADDLARQLLERSPEVIHFSGHGASNGGIVLRDESGDAQVVPGRALAMLIRSAAPAARVVVLNACYSDVQADALRGVVDCVVGMTGAIGDAAARTFAVGLYRAFGNRLSVGQAVAHGVAMLAAKQLPDEVLPRCRTRDGIDADQVLLGTPR